MQAIRLFLFFIALTLLNCGTFAQRKPILIKSALVVNSLTPEKTEKEATTIPGLEQILTERLVRTKRFLVMHDSSSVEAKTQPKKASDSYESQSNLEESNYSDRAKPQLFFDISILAQEKSAHNFDLGDLIKNVSVTGVHNTLSVSVLVRVFDSHTVQIVSAYIGYGSATATDWDVQLSQGKSSSAPSSFDEKEETTPKEDAGKPITDASIAKTGISLRQEGRNIRLSASKSPSVRLAIERAIDSALRLIVLELDSCQFMTQVAKVKSDSIYLASGSLQRIRKGDRFSIARKGELVRDPTSNRILGADYTEVGTCEVVNVNSFFSVARILSGSLPVVGDHVFCENR